MKLLKRLSTSDLGVALREHFEIKIANLVDGRNFKEDDFLVDGKARVEAAKVLKKIIIDLDLIKEDVRNRERNPYI